jgi:phage terminase large subunit-like protein
MTSRPAQPKSAAERLRGLDPAKLKQLPPEKRRAASELLRRVKRITDRNPLAAFNPYPQQREFLAARARSKLFLKGNQAGGTTIGLVDDLIQACEREAIPSHLAEFKRLEPPVFGRLFTPDFDHTMDQVLLPKLRALVPKDQLMGQSWSKAYDKRHRVLRFKSGSWFQFNSYKQEVSDLSGATLHFVHYDESPPREHRTESKIRLVRYGGNELYTLTPVEGIEQWIYEEFWEPWERGERDPEMIWIVTASMDDNPYLSEKDREWVLEGLTAEEREARRHGRFIALHGLVYPDFDRHVHVVSATSLPNNVNVIVGIDPGTRYAAAVLWAAIDTRRRWRFFEELKVPGMRIEEVCDRIHRLNAKWDVEPTMYLIDPAARSTAHQTGRSDQDVYAEHGVRAIPAQNDVRMGINRLKQLFSLEDGEPRAVIYDTCSDFIGEIKKYRWKDPPKSGEETREAPVKRDDHLADCARYMAAARPYAPKQEEEDDRTPQQRMMQEDIERAWKGDNRAKDEFGLLA